MDDDPELEGVTFLVWFSQGRDIRKTLDDLRDTGIYGAILASVAARDRQVATLGRIAALTNARESVTGNAERAAADLLKLAAEREELERERARAQGAIGDARSRVEAAETELQGLASQREAALRGRGQQARALALEADRLGETLQTERDGLQGRLSSLEEIVATHSAFDEGARALLAGPEGLEVLGVVADALDTESAYERAVEAFHGDRLQAVLVRDAQEAVRGLRSLESFSAGRAAFVALGS